MKASHLLTAAAVGAGIAFSWQLLRPGPPLIPGEDTTYLSAPLAEDGLPNYTLAILEAERHGITPENNGAIAFWRALGPVDMTEEQFERLRREYGVDLSFDSRLVDPRGEVTMQALSRWLEPATANGTDDGSAGGGLVEDVVDRLNSELLVAAWTAADAPPLADWVTANKRPLDLLVQSVAKPRFYSPSAAALADSRISVFESGMSSLIKPFKTAAISLATRATLRIGSGQYDEAWEDCRALWRLGRHCARRPTDIDRQLAIGVRGVARWVTLAILQAPNLSEELAQRILVDLRAAPAEVRFDDVLARFERFVFLDTILRFVSWRLGGPTGRDKDELPAPIRVISFDGNIPLRMGNRWYDEFAAAFAVPDYRRRRQAVATAYRDWDRAIQTDSPAKALTKILFSRDARSEWLAKHLGSLVRPAVEAFLIAQLRDATRMELTRVAAALAVHRARHGHYPSSLVELTPATLGAVPIDPFSGSPLVYQPRGEGYLLYSVFLDETDDRGTDAEGQIVDGEWVDPGSVEQTFIQDLDLVIRMPRPRVDLPKPEVTR